MIGSRLHRVATLVLFVAAIAATVVHWIRHPHESAPACGAAPLTETTVAEVIWYAFGALVLLWVPRIVEVRLHTTRAQAWVLGLGIGGMLCAQVAAHPEQTFPFVRWNMFGRPAQPLDNVVGYRLEAVAHDGSRRRLSMIDLYSFAGWRVDVELGNLARRVEQDETCRRDAGSDEQTLYAVVRRIATRVPDARTIDVVRISWPGDDDGLARETRLVRWSVAP